MTKHVLAELTYEEVAEILATGKAVAIVPASSPSLVVEATFNKKPNDWNVQLFSKYNRQYTGGGFDQFDTGGSRTAGQHDTGGAAGEHYAGEHRRRSSSAVASRVVPQFT